MFIPQHLLIIKKQRNLRQKYSKQFLCVGCVLCDSINLLGECLLSPSLRLGSVNDSQFVP